MDNGSHYPGIYEFYLGRIKAAPSYGLAAGTELLDLVARCVSSDSMLSQDEKESILYLAAKSHAKIMEDNYNEGWK